jgi:hypothetical protein
MALRVIGAGVGRTGTTSLKAALERLLGGRCYHMYEVFQHPDHVPLWRDAAAGRQLPWDAIYDGFVGTVDWPGAAFWSPLSDAYPDAVVLLSQHRSEEAWFGSVDRTINEMLGRGPADGAEDWHHMAVSLLRTTFTTVPFERTAAIRAYRAHNDRVRRETPPQRLIEWRVGDGWAPLCDRLGVAVPDEPFPHLNTTDDYKLLLDRLEPAPKRRMLSRVLGRT